MSDRRPPEWFEPPLTPEQEAELKRRKDELRDKLPELTALQHRKGRANNALPYLLVRSVLGDRGDRPINVPFWESPDIWTMAGDPSSTPAIPADHGGTVRAGEPNTVYAHVWNLGLIPLAGIYVEFYWFNPSLGISDATKNTIGVARCELASRGMPGSHLLVKCPRPWIPTLQNGGHECLIVRVHGMGDGLGANDWAPAQNRHIGMRNVTVLPSGADLRHIIDQLDVSRFPDSRLELIQVGPQEGELARRLVAPGLRIAMVETHLLGEINVAGAVVLREPATAPAGMLAPVHHLASGGPPAAPVMRGRGTTRIVSPHTMLSGERRTGGAERAHLADLLTAVPGLHGDSGTHDGPGPGEAHVIRVASYKGDQLVGGYTFVIAGS